MLFNSFVFLALFLPVTYAVFWSLSTARTRYIWLALTGYVFYGAWNPWFCLLMAFSTLVSYVAGLAFLRYESPRARRLTLLVPITVDLLLLAFFKYANFAMDSFAGLAALTGVSVSVPHLNVILPVGISFYTFHTISYVVDCYRRIIRPTRNLFEFAAYVSLFSQLVAGPIVRFRQIEEDLESLGTASRGRWLSMGISLFIVGLVEKVLIADSLALGVDTALIDYSALSTSGAWLAMLGYTFQLYFDFCGYSDMAVGLGLMFGLRIPWNFDSPYKATDPSDFWRRWHISLSTCLRDYVYIPLGGNRHGESRTHVNLMLTMLIGGLWHGANWTFVLWGAYHGVLLVLYRATASWWDQTPRVLRQLAMFVLIVFGWVLFRATDVTMAGVLASKMIVPSAGTAVPHLAAFSLVLGAAAMWAMAGPNARELHDGFVSKPAYGYLLAPLFGIVIGLMSAGAASPFLYFQF